MDFDNSTTAIPFGAYDYYKTQLFKRIHCAVFWCLLLVTVFTKITLKRQFNLDIFNWYNNL